MKTAIKLPKKARDISNQRFGRLTAIMPIRIDRWVQVIWLCECDCGKTKEVRGKHLWSGGTVSCGCFRVEHGSKKFLRHGYAKKGMVTSIHSIWQGMIGRCTNPNNERFKDYGGRGIFVCKRWMRFENFFSDMGERPRGLTLERKNNDKGYSPSNCTWATRLEQSRNKRMCVFVKAFGEIKCLAEWTLDYRCIVSNECLRKRIIHGWIPESAITTKPFGKPNFILQKSVS